MWLEAITVRTPELGELEDQIPVLLQQLTAASSETEVSAYVRCPAKSDLSFHLIRGEASGDPSPQGLQLAEALRTYGTVDHSIWQGVVVSQHESTSREL